MTTTATKTYEGVERVRARPMSHGEYIAFRGWQLPADGNPADEGYLVECVGDFISWCPKDRFDRAYCEVGQGLSFGDALKALKAGQRVARTGWNGKGMWLAYTPGTKFAPVHAKPGHAAAFRAKEAPHEDVRLLPHIDMRAADGSMVIGWLASQTDMLAEDWMVLA